MPNKIKKNIEKGKEININNNSNSIINDCINIENIIQDINKINKNIEKYRKSLNIKILFSNNKEKEIKEIIKLFGKIDLYKDFNIKNKEPIYKLNFHNNYVICLIVLNDGRLVSSAKDKSIIIYNKKTFQPDLIII